MTTKITNARIVAQDGIRDGLDVWFRDGTLLAVTGEENPHEAEADRVIDAGGAYLSAGWIDMHTHGAGGADFLDGTSEAYRTAARTHAEHGTTTLLPTTTSVDAARIVTSAAALDAVRDDPDLPDMPGLHLEGPYLAPSQKGAQEDRFIHPFDEAETDAILAASYRILRWTAAPELPGAEAFARKLTARASVWAPGRRCTRPAACQAQSGPFVPSTFSSGRPSAQTRNRPADDGAFQTAVQSRVRAQTV